MLLVVLLGAGAAIIGAGAASVGVGAGAASMSAGASRSERSWFSASNPVLISFQASGNVFPYLVHLSG